jgi:hypothetical protein
MIERLFEKLGYIKKDKQHLPQANVMRSASLANQLMEDKWWCPNCNEWVSPRDVTYEETHDVRSGGCGYAVE